MSTTRFAYLRSTLLWSILAAAFIGPGTVATAAKAGAGFGLGLVWALLFSILATMVLQEMAARLTLASGKRLGQIVAGEQGNGRWIALLLFSAIALGCGAYQAGNLLGSFAGIRLLADIDRYWVVALAAVAGLLLWSGNIKLITRLLAGVVAIMGLTFLWVAVQTPHPAAAWGAGLVPAITDQSALLIIGLIGTTIVPYNLFLAAGISPGQSIGDMRRGLLTSIFLGGIITLAILLVGTQVSGEFSFAALAETLSRQLGDSARYLFAIGLAAAGLSSAITAPLAAAITGQSLYVDRHPERWSGQGRYFRYTWGSILGAGLLFALTDVQPIPAIIAAQAINGFILPLVAGFLLVRSNDAGLLAPAYRNPLWLNITGLLIVGITIFLGLHNLWLTAGKLVPSLLAAVSLGQRAVGSGVVAVLVVVWLGGKVVGSR